MFDESRKLIKALERRRLKFIGNILICNKFVTNIIESKTIGKRGGGTQRNPIKHWMLWIGRSGCDYKAFPLEYIYEMKMCGDYW